MGRLLLAAICAALFLLGDSVAAAADARAPLYLSLKTADANGRHGPGLEHRIDWIYERVGLPLRVTGESGPWRRVRDPDGAEVWIHVQNLSPRRTVLVIGDRPAALRRQAQANARPAAYLEPGVIGALTGCEGGWRRVTVAGRVGWVESNALWGGEDCAGL